MSSSSDQHTENSDAKIATESAPPGMNSITNTVGMHRTPSDSLSAPPPHNTRRGSCDKPGLLDNNRDLSIATHNRAQDLQIADNQRKEIILQEYHKTLSKLIEKYGPYLNETEAVSLVARFTTLSAMNQLDPARRNFLIRLLYDAKLINYRSILDAPAISLESANLIELCLIDGTIGQTLTHFTMKGAIMSKSNFHGINIHGAIFNNAVLDNADFSSTTNGWFCSDNSCSESNRASLHFVSTDLTSTSFARAVYDNAWFDSAMMFKTNLHLFQCDYCVFYLANMTQINLRNAEILNSSFGLTTFERAEIHQSIFSRNTDFSSANMNYANITYNNFTQCQFSFTTLRNVKFLNNVVVNSTFTDANMFGISMMHSIFIDVNFTGAKMNESNWRYVLCERCIFYFGHFNDADLTNSIFIDSDFRNSTISQEQLNQAASFNGSILPNLSMINSK